jgi:hypothetical protein
MRRFWPCRSEYSIALTLSSYLRDTTLAARVATQKTLDSIGSARVHGYRGVRGSPSPNLDLNLPLNLNVSLNHNPSPNPSPAASLVCHGLVTGHVTGATSRITNAHSACHDVTTPGPSGPVALSSRSPACLAVAPSDGGWSRSPPQSSLLLPFARFCHRHSYRHHYPSIAPTQHGLGRPGRVGTPGGTGRTSKIPDTHGPWDGGTGPDPQGPPSILPAETARACSGKSGPEQSFSTVPPRGICVHSWLRPIPHPALLIPH